jgi:hypothetical protein
MLTRLLLLAATLLGGLLAGVDLDRALVAIPAWQELGAEAWTAFSRKADLGNGLILYPLEAIGSTVLTLAAALSFRFDQTAPRAASLSLYGAALLAAAGLAFTLKAAPIMLGIRGTSDPVALQHAFEGFVFWGNVRGVCQVLAFVAQLWALLELVRQR